MTTAGSDALPGGPRRLELSLPPHLLLGMKGERMAAAALRNNGYRILDHNWRFGHLELDLVCEDGEFIVFVEVKTRCDSSRGGPSGAITGKKKGRLLKAAQAWLLRNRAWERPCRFDVVCITGTDENFCLEHYCNAFQLRQTVDRSHSSWQPW